MSYLITTYPNFVGVYTYWHISSSVREEEAKATYYIFRDKIEEGLFLFFTLEDFKDFYKLEIIERLKRRVKINYEMVENLYWIEGDSIPYDANVIELN